MVSSRIFLVFLCFKLADGKACVQTGVCKCTFEDGSGVFDLSPIGRQNGTPLIQDQFAPDNYAYSFNPCFPFTEGSCVNAAACQYDSNNNIYHNIGDSSKVNLSFDGQNLIGTYISDDGARSSTVTFKCDPNANVPMATPLGETSTTVYGFNVISKYACPERKPTPTPEPVERCFTNFGDFTKKCTKAFDGNAASIKVLIIDDWDGSCDFPASLDVAVALHSMGNPSCDDVIKKCNPVQPFSVNGYVCKNVFQGDKDNGLI